MWWPPEENAFKGVVNLPRPCPPSTRKKSTELRSTTGPAQIRTAPQDQRAVYTHGYMAITRFIGKYHCLLNNAQRYLTPLRYQLHAINFAVRDLQSVGRPVDPP